MNTNLSHHAGDSLVSGGEGGHGHLFVSIHDAILDPCNLVKCDTNIQRIIITCAHSLDKKKAVDLKKHKPTAYSVLFECYGHPDQNLSFLSNQISYFGLFLVKEMDKLTATSGFHEFSYINSVKGGTLVIQLAISCLSLVFSLNTEKLLLNEVLADAISMKAVRK